MDFNQSKEELLKNISQQKQSQMLDRRNLEAKNRIKEKASGISNFAELVVASEKEKTSKPPVAVFGLKSLFMSTLKNLLQQYCEVYEFDEVESATDFLFGNKIPIAIMDMDPPNDWKACQDFCSTGKTMNPDMRYIVYQKDEIRKLSEPAEVLQKQGAMILQKPLDRIELVELIKKFTAEWREKNATKSQSDNGISE